MANSALFIIGTLLSWIGIGVVFSVIAKLITRFASPGPAPKKFATNTASMAVFGLVCLTGGGLITNMFERAKSLIKVPIFWPVMPWMAWLAVACLVGAIACSLRWVGSVSRSEKSKYQKWVLSLLACLPVLIVLYGLDPSGDKKWNIELYKPELLKGAVPLSYQSVGAITLLAILAVLAMTYASRSASARGIGKSVGLHLSLLTGSVVFGLPFAFLLVTSFKESEDMVGKDGIIWTPRVTRTHKYFDPRPDYKHYEVMVEGRKVDALVIGQEGDKVHLDVHRPLGMRGLTFYAKKSDLKEIPSYPKVYSYDMGGIKCTGFVTSETANGEKTLQALTPENVKGKSVTKLPGEFTAIRDFGLRTENYTEALEYLPASSLNGLVPLKNTLFLVVLNVIGTLLSSSIVAYAFARMRFPGRDLLFKIVLATMALPATITRMPQFLIFRWFGWIDTLHPLWVPAFLGSAFNIFLLRQFFIQVPKELEDAAKIDGCSYFKTYWNVVLPQVKPALAAIAVLTFIGVWNDFQGPLIYINSTEKMPISYTLQLFQGDRSTEFGLLMAFATMTFIPVVVLFFLTQKYIVENTALSGLGGR